MKKFYIFRTFVNFFILLLTYPVLSQNNLIIKDTLIEPSNNFWVEINLDNSDDVVGFQFDIKFPNEITYLDSIILGSRYTDHTISLTPIEDSGLRLLSFSLSNSPIIDSTGILLKLLCQAGSNDAEVLVEIYDAILAGSNGTNILDSINNGIIEIQSPVNVHGFNIPSKTNSESQIHVYPNPFNNSTIINYFSSTLLPFELTTFSIDGRELSKKEIIPSNIGRNEEIVNMSSLATGMYILKLQSIENISVAKILLIK